MDREILNMDANIEKLENILLEQGAYYVGYSNLCIIDSYCLLQYL